MYVAKVTFTAPSVEGVGGNLNHRSWSYISKETEAEFNYEVAAALNDFVMKTGVNKDMVTVTKEWDNETEGAS